MPDVPEGAKQPTDHKKSAAQREAEQPEEVTIQYGGREYTIPATFDLCDGSVLEMLDVNNESGAVKAVLGGKQAREFGETKPRIKDWRGLGQVIFQDTYELGAAAGGQ